MDMKDIKRDIDEATETRWGDLIAILYNEGEDLLCDDKYEYVFEQGAITIQVNFDNGRGKQMDRRMKTTYNHDLKDPEYILYRIYSDGVSALYIDESRLLY